MKILRIAVVAAILPVSAQAASLFLFEATGVTRDPSDVTPGLEADKQASLRFVFDATTPDPQPSTALGFYGNPFVGDVVATFGEIKFTAPSPSGAIFVQTFDTLFEFRGDTSSTATSSISINTKISFQFSDFDPEPGKTDALPLSLDLADFQNHDSDLASISVSLVKPDGTDGATASAYITSVSITPVAPIPLPGALPLLAAGLGGLALLRRRT